MYTDPSLPLDQRLDDLISRLTPAEKIAQMGHAAQGVERLGIRPYNWWSECLHGVARNGLATVFPQAIGLAAAFDPDLIRRIGSAISDEGRAKYRHAVATGNAARYTGLTFWTPTINIYRDPRWGRGQETYGEDPFLTGTLGAAMVRGIQGDHPRYLKAGACAKHFAVHSGPEGERHVFDARVSKQDLHETYLPAFKRLVDEGVEVVMGAYNRLDGEPCCGSWNLLTGLLREQWGFEGHVTSDCWAIDGFHKNSKATCSQLDSVVLALNAGCDLCCGDVYPLLNEALEKGMITEADIDRSFRRLARTWFRLGFFDPDEQVPFTAIPDSVINCDAHRALAREAAAKSCVLLKNAGEILPLKEPMRILYLVGPHAASVDVLLGNYFGASRRLTTILEGIVGRVHAGCAVEYKLGTLTAHPNLNPVDWVSFESAKADVCIAVMGVHPMMEGEEGEAIMSADIGDRTDLDLPANQVRFLKKIKKAGARLVVVMTGGGPVTCPEVYDFADAILWVWYPGEAGGEGVADILFGDVNPSGRLPITFPKDVRDLPPFEDYSMDGRTYRFMEKEPLFPFGFGLSYSTFAYGPLSLCLEGDRITAEVEVSNTGARAGDEIVQLYARYLGEPGFRIAKQSLVGFRRVSIAAGEKAAVRFELETAALSLVDAEGRRVLAAGDYELIAAAACPIPRSRALGAPEPSSATITLGR